MSDKEMFRYLAEPRITLAEPLCSAEPRLKNTDLMAHYLNHLIYFAESVNY